MNTIFDVERTAIARAERLFPMVPKTEVARAAHQAAQLAMKRVEYEGTERLPQIALQEMQVILSLYVGLMRMRHVPVVA